jgi:hypothetical protein
VPSDEDNLVILLEVEEEKLRQKWGEVIQWLQAQWTLEAIEAALGARNFEAFVADVERVANHFAVAVTATYGNAGAAAALNVQSATGAPVLFDQVAERPVRFARETKMRFVREISLDQRNTLTNIVTRGIRNGINPRKVAEELRQSIGLTQRQEDAVHNFERLLRSGDRDALVRELRDRRFDGSVERAIEAGRPLTERQIQAMVARYRQRYLSYRAEVIARTEALQAVHRGSGEMYQQAIESGEISSGAIRRTWRTAGGVDRRGRLRTRHSHRPMNGQLRLWGEPFMSGHGNALRYPGDLDAPARETIQCRCLIVTRLA